jgi:hypothetical protein
MKLRHAAALALVGWFLMMPPLLKKSVDLTAPFSRWVTVNSYDTSKQCEDEKASIQDAAPENLSQLKSQLKGLGIKDDPADNKERLKIAHDMYFDEVVVPLAQCIASDDPRLKGK